MPLHLDYRPPDFGSFIGNESLIDSLTSIFVKREADYPHAILFHGPSGCGKTTLARIIAGHLGCPEKIDGAINSDFVEINAGNNRGIDTAREILENMNFKPWMAESRVWIIDEAHQTTKDFQNAMLKALEDTPSHVYFILCTTEPEKIIKTIRNRCSKFEVKSLSDNQIVDLIWHTAKAEGIEDISNDDLSSMAKAVEGCPREALVLLDQIIDLNPDQISRAIQEFKTQEAQVIDLCRALVYGKSWDVIQEIIKGIDAEPEKIRYAVINYVASIVLNPKNRKGDRDNARLIFECFKEPFFYQGKGAIAFACLEVVDPI